MTIGKSFGITLPNSSILRLVDLGMNGVTPQTFFSFPIILIEQSAEVDRKGTLYEKPSVSGLSWHHCSHHQPQ